MRREAEDTGPYAEFEHWRQLNARFNSVLEQIRSHECRMAIQILHISKAKVLKVTHIFQQYFAPNLLEIDQNNLRMKFAA